MQKITLRKAKATDIPHIMKLMREADFITEGAQYDTPDYFECSIKEGIFFVATLNKELVGFIHGEKLMWNGAVIWYFVVDGNHRDLGIGSSLITHFEDYCKHHNIKWIFGASDINKKTLNFYKRHEYVLSEKYIEFTKNL